MPAKKESHKKNTVKKVAPAAKKTKKPDLKTFLTEIENKAYELYQARTKSGIPGDEMSDWLAAETEMKEKYKL